MTTRKYSSRSQQTTLTGAVTSGATSITVVSGTALLGGVTIPAGTTFTLVLDPDTAIEEIVDATAVSTNTFTITRAIDGSSAQDHSAGAVVRHMAIGRDYRDANLHAEASAYYNDGSGSGHTMHGIGSGEGDVVGTLKTQTLTNKTLTAPTISDPTITGTASAGAVLVFEGATADAYETTLTVVDPTQDNTITMPNTTGTVVIATATQTLTNKTLTSPVISGSPVITGLSSAGMVASSATPKDYVDSILGSATAAATSAASAATSAASAATSATSAANSATASAASAATAATSATAAATSATSAAASATAAATSATSSAASATTAQAWAIQLVTPVSGSDYSAKYNANLAAASASSASTSASSAATSASSAATSATNAANSATASASSASAAATSATSAAASATAAATSATSAAASATAAATSATSAAASATAAAGYVVPSQTGNAGKFLGTDGTAVSWTRTVLGTFVSNSASGDADSARNISLQIDGTTYGRILVPTGSGGAMAFWTGSTPAERMRIDSAGAITAAGSATFGTVNVTSTTSSTNGMFLPAANTLDITTNSTRAIRINSTQQVGIGMTPTTTLDITGTNVRLTPNTNVATNGFAFNGTSSNALWATMQSYKTQIDGVTRFETLGSGITSIGTSAGTAMMQIVNIGSNTANPVLVVKGAASQTGDLLQVQDSAATVLARITSAGNVGIGTAPSTTLHVSSGSGARVRAGGATGSGFEFNDANTRFDIPAANTIAAYTGNAERMRIDSAGNVGIGNNNPQADLHIGSSTTVSDFRMGNSAAATVLSMYSTSNDMVIYNATAGGVLQLGTNNTERIRIDSSGNTTINAIADATTTTAARGGGYMGIPQSAASGSGAYTVVAADAGEHIYTTTTRTVTIPANASVAFPVGTVLSFISGVGATTTIAITSDTMYLAGAGTTGSRTLAAHGMATAVKVASTTWYISGNGLT